jgi:hypothetical protein
MRRAARLAAVGSWDAAAEIWIAQSASHRRKIRARALHNLSVLAERQGNYQLSIEHAQNAFGNKGYNLTAAQIAHVQRRLDYLRVFEQRAAHNNGGK